MKQFFNNNFYKLFIINFIFINSITSALAFDVFPINSSLNLDYMLTQQTNADFSFDIRINQSNSIGFDLDISYYLENTETMQRYWVFSEKLERLRGFSYDYSYNHDTRIFVRPDMPVGKYRLYIILDSANNLNETDKSNNSTLMGTIDNIVPVTYYQDIYPLADYSTVKYNTSKREINHLSFHYKFKQDVVLNQGFFYTVYLSTSTDLNTAKKYRIYENVALIKQTPNNDYELDSVVITDIINIKESLEGETIKDTNYYIIIELDRNENFKELGGYQNIVVLTSQYDGDIFIDDEETSISSIQNNEFSVYPNPTSNELNIKCSCQISSVEIMGYDGKKYNDNLDIEGSVIQLNQLSSNIYTIIVKDINNNIYKRKFIKL